MCPITASAKMVLNYIFLAIFLFWLVGVPLLILMRLEKIMKILEKKDPK